MLEFHFIETAEFPQYAEALYRILHTNMSVIAPTGNSYEEDLHIWRNAMTDVLQDEARRIIRIEQDGQLIGYFQYTAKDGAFAMEDIQFAPQWHGKGDAFRALYGFVLAGLPEGVRWVEADASKQNGKSQGILKRLGLQIVGENPSGRSDRFRGAYADLLHWYSGEAEL